MSETASTAEALCHHVVSSIVDDADAVSITSNDLGTGTVRLDVRVAQGEMGRVIGRRGRVAQAIRTLVRAAGARDDVDIEVEFVD